LVIKKTYYFTEQHSRGTSSMAANLPPAKKPKTTTVIPNNNYLQLLFDFEDGHILFRYLCEGIDTSKLLDEYRISLNALIGIYLGYPECRKKKAMTLIRNFSEEFGVPLVQVNREQFQEINIAFIHNNYGKDTV